MIVAWIIGGFVGWLIPKGIGKWFEKTALQKIRSPYKQMSEVFLTQLTEPSEDFFIITGDGSSFLGLPDPWVHIVLIGRHERMKIIFTHYVQETKERVDEYIDSLRKIDVNHVDIVNIARGATEKGLQAAGINEDRSIVWIKVSADESGKAEAVGGKTKYYRKYVGRPLRFPYMKILHLLLKTKTTDDLRKKYELKRIVKMQREYHIPEKKIELLADVIDKKYYNITETKHGGSRLCKICPYFLHYDTQNKRFYYEIPVVKEHSSKDLVKLIMGYFNLQKGEDDHVIDG
jgi:hypothetical protein